MVREALSKEETFSSCYLEDKKEPILQGSLGSVLGKGKQVQGDVGRKDFRMFEGQKGRHCGSD